MTKQDMITAIVQAGIDGGWRKEDEVELGTIYKCIWDEWRVCIIEPYEERIFTIPDLIFNPDFMKAIWGEETVCQKCGNPLTATKNIAYCGRILKNCGWGFVIPAYIYHQKQVIKLSDGDYIKYLYEQLPKGGGDE